MTLRIPLQQTLGSQKALIMTKLLRMQQLLFLLAYNRRLHDDVLLQVK
jgi:hypothetical protein